MGIWKIFWQRLLKLRLAWLGESRVLSCSIQAMDCCLLNSHLTSLAYRLCHSDWNVLNDDQEAGRQSISTEFKSSYKTHLNCILHPLLRPPLFTSIVNDDGYKLQEKARSSLKFLFSISCSDRFAMLKCKTHPKLLLWQIQKQVAGSRAISYALWSIKV